LDPKILHKVIVDGKEFECGEDSSLLNALTNAGVVVPTACSGKGSCHLCRIKIKEPPAWLAPASPLEDRALGNVLVASGMRLSCQIALQGPVELEIPVARARRKKKKK
jgi:Na+-transporting NADH:ubiquinone oxidoreductase subunit F